MGLIINSRTVYDSDIHSFAMSDIALAGSDVHSFGMSDIFAFRQIYRKGFALSL